MKGSDLAMKLGVWESLQIASFVERKGHVYEEAEMNRSGHFCMERAVGFTIREPEAHLSESQVFEVIVLVKKPYALIK